MKTKMIEVNGKPREHVWSEVAYDYSSKMTVTPVGTMTYEKTGTWVMTAESATTVLKERQGW